MRSSVFISRASADADFAAVVGTILESAGYHVILQQWDFANRNFIERMHAALAEGARVIALLSPEYLTSEHCAAEWQNAIAGDPLNRNSRLILLRVSECEPPGMLSGLAYWDVVPVLENRPLLEDIVRDAVREIRRAEHTSGPYWRAPRSIVDAEAIRPVSSFSGRETELAALSQALAGGSGIAVLYGLGGLGKSSLAREHAWRHRDEYSVIWWLHAQTEDAIVEGLLRLGSLFVRGLDRHTDRRAAAAQVTGSVLSGFAKPVLLIFDNLEDERLLRTWLPRAGACALVTSNSAAWSADIAAIALQTWELDIAVAYLQRESGRSDLTQDDARAVAEALGCLPLALAHAAASLRGMRMTTASRYLERIGEQIKNAPRNAEYPRSVYATFSTAIAQAQREAPGAAAALCFAASFAPDAIPDELFRQAIEEYRPDALRSAVAGELHLDAALGALDRLSLLAFSQTSRTYDMHRLVQHAARDLMGDERQTWRECAIAVADRAFPEVEFEVWPQCERLLVHALAALDALGDAPFLPAGLLAGKCGFYLLERGEYDQAEPLLDRALAIVERVLGPEDVAVADALENLGILYDRRGRYEEEVPLHLRVVTIREKALGSNHPDVATSLNNLALVYERLERYGEAIPLYLRALAIDEEVPEMHPNVVATTLNNLANVYYRMGRLSDAEPLHARALAMREASLGPEHPDIVQSLTNLARTYAGQQRYDEAMPLNLRAVALGERVLGPDHPIVGFSLYNLAGLYVAQERLEEAEALYARALALREKALGAEHPEVLAIGEKLRALRAPDRSQGDEDSR
ncbi:MAG TPA: tetratricopeptide repeat protein [Candidatus Nitrosotalea sp.]|nr:tetratricopeptide repeat protein [Candidatus Nitrosotalea sp.]